MTLDPCPNCSGFNFSYGHWIIGRPHLLTGKKSAKVFILGCCAFSNRCNQSYNDETSAAESWRAFRTTQSALDRRLTAMLVKLDKREQELGARFAAAV